MKSNNFTIQNTNQLFFDKTRQPVISSQIEKIINKETLLSQGFIFTIILVKMNPWDNLLGDFLHPNENIFLRQPAIFNQTKEVLPCQNI